jgi:acetate CoA/acetoacetate CoA-transferase alpha subunit
MVKFISAKEAVQFFKNNQSIMIGGFIKCGTPTQVIDELLSTDISDLTLIANDTSLSNSDRGKLISAHKIKKAIVSHIGTNPDTVAQMNDGILDVELVPQGTLAERIRAGGAGLGGVLTPTGVGTSVADGKQIVNVDGQDFILEKPLKADVALVYATNADKFGNLSFFGSTRNFNAVMPPAAKVVIAEVDNLFDEPLDPNHVVVPGIFVDYIIVKDKK